MLNYWGDANRIPSRMRHLLGLGHFKMPDGPISILVVPDLCA